MLLVVQNAAEFCIFILGLFLGYVWIVVFLFFFSFFPISWGWLLSPSSYMTGPYLRRAPWSVHPVSHSGTKGTDTYRDYHPGNDGACHPQNCGSGSQPLMRTRSNVSGNDFASLWPQWETLDLKSSPTLGARTEEFCSVDWRGSYTMQAFTGAPTEIPLMRHHSTQDILAGD